ncbi:MAG: hypothetical protein JSV58_05495 [Candidatus Bathyarchaeota archaeon]|nr:MAG: hypothetical protein JSV58_05495 [Candidatus Bathyarchaeota archaeon]
MGPSERRVIGSLLLMLGLTCLALGLHTGQLSQVAELVTTVFQTAIAGIP